MSALENRAMYIAWLRTDFPELYDRAVTPLVRNARQVGLSGFFDTLVGGIKSVAASVGQALPGLAKTYVEYDVQRRLIEANTKRAQQGMAPLMYDSTGRLVTASGIPYSQADLALAQLAQPALPGQVESSLDANTLLLFGGLAVVTVLLLTRSRRR